MPAPPANTGGPSDSDASADAPSWPRQVFASLFTPSWSLGLLLFICLFLPSYRGCNDEVISMVEIVGSTEPALDSVYQAYLFLWPFLFGLLTAAGTLWLVTGRNPRRALVMWSCSAALIMANALILLAAFIASRLEQESASTLVDLGDAWWLLVPSALLVLLVFLTGLRCRTSYSAAMWLQLALAFVAALSVSLLTPGLLFAKHMLIGGHLALTASVFLVVVTVIQQIDGLRVLLRRRGESPIQLSLRVMLLLMLLGGIACAWIGGGLVIEGSQSPTNAEESEQATEPST